MMRSIHSVLSLRKIGCLQSLREGLIPGGFAVPSRSFATRMRFVKPAADIPSNLLLSDDKVVREAPKIKTQLPIHAQFPLLKVPESIEVRKFHGSSNEVAGTIPLSKTIFEVPIRVDIIHELVRYVRAKRRQPKKTKTIAEIKGSNKKPHPQKKVGMSQIGNIRNSAVRGGQKAHGPVIRDYSIGMPKKSRALATMMVIAAKYREGNLLIFDDLEMESLKTREMVERLAAHGLEKSLVLMVHSFWSENFYKASRNLRNIEIKTLRNLDGYEILRKEKLVFSAKAFQQIQEKLVYQYTQGGKAKSTIRNMKSYLAMVEEGKRLAASLSSSNSN